MVSIKDRKILRQMFSHYDYVGVKKPICMRFTLYGT